MPFVLLRWADESSRRCRRGRRDRVPSHPAAPVRVSPPTARRVHRVSRVQATARPGRNDARNRRAPPRPPRPQRNSVSSPTFTSDHPHHGPRRVFASCSISLAAIGPLSRNSRRNQSRKTLRSEATRPLSLNALARNWSIRQRNNGHMSTGKNVASWPQYSRYPEPGAKAS